ncbi:MAG TPA: cytochrome-c oxidase [Nitrospiraceae bacterium]|jgi:cytochrome c oxidase subunit 2|nr:cytochrome-c oxidase [Nitrospiraceae bacterium]
MKSVTQSAGFLSVLVLAFLITLTASAFSQDQGEQVIKVTAKKFEYSPNEIRLKKGVPVVLELTSLDRLHGFNCPDLGVRADIFPGKVSRVRIVPDKAGPYEFHCDIFCGEGHEGMTGKLIVEE